MSSKAVVARYRLLDVECMHAIQDFSGGDGL
jgi:hypothetical protein